ncbi:uncharacterized protein si:dkey-200l5.4 isoform X2 [Pimephales promelas]|uniref:uncharacterized protein si:dkey-200l5.4 isoform X2 n=1 Tax=Pimephales promelas TaxID=90988 RepID=UPI001955EC1B|nr:uncharacterized protein si:dkey-200l5.4 isoform X2 [Pimephales promelas]KAG1970730.1 hypothetical protein F2P79_002161 [Pimephales promelas]
MRTGIAIMLFVAVAGFHNAISASLEFDESNKSPEERMYEENVTTTQPDDSEYAAAHVNVTEDLLKTTHMDGETEALTFDTDGETEALTVDTGENTGSDESVDFSEEDTSQQKTEHIEQAEETVKITGVFFDDAYEEQSVFE